MSRPRPRAGYPQHVPPLWITAPATEDFKSDPRCRCIGKQHLYFDDSIEALAACQALCASCPLFQPCTRWTLQNYKLQPFGIFAGLTEHVRARIFYGAEEWYDWRTDWRQRYAKKLIKRRYHAAELRRGNEKGFSTVQG